VKLDVTKVSNLQQREPNVYMNFFPKNFPPYGELMGIEKQNDDLGKESYFKADLKKLERTEFSVSMIPKSWSVGQIQKEFNLNREGFTVVDLMEQSSGIASLLVEHKEILDRINTTRQGWSYDPAFGTRMRAGQEEFLHSFVKEEQRKGTLELFDYDDYPVAVDSVLVQTDADGSTATGAMFAHVDLPSETTLVELFKTLGDTWLPRIFYRNKAVREAALEVFRAELESAAPSFSASSVEAATGRHFRSGSSGLMVSKDEFLLEQLALDLVTDLSSKQWKSDDEIGSRFWRFISVQEILNVWVALVPNGISANTATNSFAVMNKSPASGYREADHRFPYTARRKASQDGLLKRSEVFHPYGIKFEPEQDWWTMEDMKLGQAYLWKAQSSPHGACRHLSKSNKSHGYPGSRVSMDSRVLFLKVDVEGLRARQESRD